VQQNDNFNMQLVIDLRKNTIKSPLLKFRHVLSCYTNDELQPPMPLLLWGVLG
jgi:hypothetical protein